MDIKNWPGLKIKHRLEEAGSSQADVARDCHVTRTQIHRVIFQGQVSDHVRRKIAAKIGVPVEKIWPEYYLRDMVA